MKTLTITEGRERLGFWLKQAVAGEDLAFVCEGKIVALRPVTVYSEDYGITEAGMKAAARRIRKNIAQERRRGTIKAFKGGADALHD
jgi:hypothetical protein